MSKSTATWWLIAWVILSGVWLVHDERILTKQAVTVAQLRNDLQQDDDLISECMMKKP